MIFTYCVFALPIGNICLVASYTDVLWRPQKGHDESLLPKDLFILVNSLSSGSNPTSET